MIDLSINMLIHAFLIAFISAKNDTNLFAHGIAQYQLSKNTFESIHWKYFDSPDKSRENFSIGDIVSIVGKYGMESSEQYFTMLQLLSLTKITQTMNSTFNPSR